MIYNIASVGMSLYMGLKAGNKYPKSPYDISTSQLLHYYTT